MIGDDPFDLTDDDAAFEPAPAHTGGGRIAQAAAANANPAYLEGLNAEQKVAVETLDGPVLVLAGAGTGKTRVLTTRLAHLIATGRAWPGQILAVTFTNKAAREMKDRVGAVIGGQVEGMPWLGTFHSVGSRILRRHAELVGLDSNFTILDTDDQLRLLKQLIAVEGIDEKRWPPRMMAALIDKWKNRGLAPDKVPAAEGGAFANGRGVDLYAAYQARLKTLNAVDFGDLLMLNLDLFRKHPDVLADYQKRFKYILVDEYQDTNVAQYLWLRLLAQSHKNICCVGDDDQSIYGWRGAEVGNILRFEEDFEGATIIRLERNYRSTKQILKAASHLIDENRDRLGKTLWTDDKEGPPVIIQGVWDGEEEARVIGEEIEQLQRQGESLEEMAVLVRAGFQTRAFEERFLTLGLPYRVIGGPRFYERMEIRDALAYLRVIAQGNDDLAFERIINKPKRGLGDATVKALNEHARANGISMAKAAEALANDPDSKLRPQARKSLKNLMDDFARWRSLVPTMEHGVLAETVLDESGYIAMWRDDKSPDAPTRVENLQELVEAMAAFENLAGFLEHIALVMENDAASDEDKVSLMTLHGSKGLEFNNVFLPGWEEGLFPSQRTMDESGMKGLEEERRLAYVGITRAKERAHIMFVANRFMHGRWLSAIPSRFVDELPEDEVEIRSDQGAYGAGDLMAPQFAGAEQRGFDSSYNTPGWQRGQRRAQVVDVKPSHFVPNESRKLTATSAPSSDFKMAERVFHDKFGYGEIIAIEGNKLTIRFDKAGEKKVIDRFVEAAP